MSEVENPPAEGNRPPGHDLWTVWAPERETAKHYETRGEAEDRIDSAEQLGVEAELWPPGESPEDLYHADGVPEDMDSRDPLEPEPETDGGPDQPDGPEPVDAEVIKTNPRTEPDTVEVENADAEPVEPTPERADPDLPDRSVGEDPLTWVPGEFVDEIDGSQAINRKGFEVLSHFYDISISADLQTPPEDTGHEYCRVKATATTPDGRSCEAFGSAHVDRGDDPELLLEMADTRARKRALSIATGVGAVAVAELKNEVEQ